ncbi:hypothetical protein PHSC3_000354 [Chlamydiales bacterium STE3]|nr:hypothetical protein PHSC3_000354 [Chlamydiales bacterium STE3]
MFIRSIKFNLRLQTLFDDCKSDYKSYQFYCLSQKMAKEHFFSLIKFLGVFLEK